MNEFTQYSAALKEECRQRIVTRKWAKDEAGWLIRSAMKRRWSVRPPPPVINDPEPRQPVVVEIDPMFNFLYGRM